MKRTESDLNTASGSSLKYSTILWEPFLIFKKSKRILQFARILSCFTASLKVCALETLSGSKYLTLWLCMCSPTIYFIVKKFSRMNFSMSVFWPCGESGKFSSLVKISCYTVICTRFSFMRVTYYIHIHQRLSSWLLHCICKMFSIKFEAKSFHFLQFCCPQTWLQR